MRIVATTLLLVAGLLHGLSLAGEPEVIKFIPNGGGPKWSPDGKYVSYYLNGYLWLYNVAADSSWQAAKFHGQKYEWLNDSQVVFMDMKHSGRGTDRHRKVTLTFTTIGSIERGIESDSSKQLISREGSPPGLYSDRAGTVALIMSDTTILLSTNGINRGMKQSRFFRAAVVGYPGSHPRGKPLPEDKGLWLLDVHGEKLRHVTDNSEYIPPQLSPNGLLITARDMGGYTVIMDTNGVKVIRLYHAGSECWDSKSKVLYFVRTIEDGNTILGGDVFRYSLEADTVTQLTFTPDIAEMKPRVSPDGMMLAYRTFRKDPDGIEILLLEGERK